MAVYFMQSVGGGPIKIGYSTDVDRRREELEETYGTSMAVLATMPGGRKEEGSIHARFSHLRIKGTEQFRPCADLMDFIGRPLLVDANPGAIEVMLAATKPIRVDLSPETHRLLRLVSADEDVSMAAYARVQLESILRQEVARRGIKG